MSTRHRRYIIQDVITDMVTDLLYYDRKEDEDLPVGAIEAAIRDGEITGEEIADMFKAALLSDLREMARPADGEGGR